MSFCFSFLLLYAVLNWNDKIRCDLAFWVRLYALALKLISILPLVNTVEMVCVVAVGQNPKVAFTGVGFLIDHFHADPTHHVLIVLDSKRELHVLLGLNAKFYML